MMVEVLHGVADDDEHEFTIKEIQEARAAEYWIIRMGRWTTWKQEEWRFHGKRRGGG
jgi:hypothetical protein